MNQKKKLYLFKYLIYLALAGLVTTYFFALYGVGLGIHLAALIWSFYVLSIPGGHGQYIIGIPCFFVGGWLLHTEILIWILAILLNIVTYFFMPYVYLKAFFSHFLYRMISTPYPYWFVISVSACGTFYNFLVGEHYFKRQSFKHGFIRSLLVLLGISTFFYFSYQDMIILLNAIL